MIDSIYARALGLPQHGFCLKPQFTDSSVGQGDTFYRYVDASPPNAADPTGEFAWLGPAIIGAGVGAGGGAVGSIAAQLWRDGCVDWKTVRDAAAWGAGAGAAWPFIAATKSAATIAGGGVSAVQYVATTGEADRSVTGYLAAVVAGAAGGAIAGPFNWPRNIFRDATQAQVRGANLTREVAGRAVAGGAVSNATGDSTCNCRGR